jgi:ATP-dependent RNA helicase DDX3X
MAEEPSKMEREERAEQARAHGWAAKTAFDYGKFTEARNNSVEWHSMSAKYEWKEEFGDVAPRLPELENILFGGEFVMRKGDHYHNLELEVTIDGETKVDPVMEVSSLITL